MKKNSSTKSSLTTDSGVQQVFVLSALNMSWQLAVTILVPLIGGVMIDGHFKTSPVYTMVGLVAGIFMSCIVVWRAFKRLNKATAVKLANKKDKK